MAVNHVKASILEVKESEVNKGLVAGFEKEDEKR